MNATELELASEPPLRFAVADDHQMGAGKQGAVYAAEFDSTLAVKLYHRRVDGDPRRLEAMMLIAKPEDFEIRPSGAGRGHQQLAWPNNLVRDPESNEIVGYTMPRYPRHEFLQLDALWHMEGRAEHVPGASWLFLLTVARNLATLAAMVHERGLVLGDVRDANFVFSPRTGLVALLDCDSMPITDPRTDDLYPCFWSHPDYAPPELQAGSFRSDQDRPRSEDTDNFSLAVLFCRLLLAGTHPFTGFPAASVEDDEEPGIGANIRAGRSYLVAPEEVLVGDVVDPQVIPAPVLKLARQAFSSGVREPAKRPSSAEWRAALSTALKHVSDCERYPERHKYSGDLWACPWCQGAFDPFPPPLPPPAPDQTSPALALVMLVLAMLVLAGTAAALLLSHVI